MPSCQKFDSILPPLFPMQTGSLPFSRSVHERIISIILYERRVFLYRTGNNLLLRNGFRFDRNVAPFPLPSFRFFDFRDNSERMMVINRYHTLRFIIDPLRCRIVHAARQTLPKHVRTELDEVGLLPRRLQLLWIGPIEETNLKIHGWQAARVVPHFERFRCCR